MSFLSFLNLSPAIKGNNTVEDAIRYGNAERLNKLLKKGYYTNASDFCVGQFIAENDNPSFLSFLKNKGFNIFSYDFMITAIDNKHYQILDYYCSAKPSKNDPDFKKALQFTLDTVKNPTDLKNINPALNSFKKALTVEAYMEIEKVFLNRYLLLNLEEKQTAIKRSKI